MYVSILASKHTPGVIIAPVAHRKEQGHMHRVHPYVRERTPIVRSDRGRRRPRKTCQRCQAAEVPVCVCVCVCVCVSLPAHVRACVRACVWGFVCGVLCVGGVGECGRKRRYRPTIFLLLFFSAELLCVRAQVQRCGVLRKSNRLSLRRLNVKSPRAVLTQHKRHLCNV